MGFARYPTRVALGDYRLLMGVIVGTNWEASNMKPLLQLKNYPSGFSEIIKHFEAGKPLSSNQLNFIYSHQRALSNSVLDPVLRYYLLEHKLNPNKAIPLQVSRPDLTVASLQELKYDLHLLLRNQLTQVDLEMSEEQFRQFKNSGIEELVFWHGDHYMPATFYHQGSLQHRLYFQWGRMFGVVKFHFRVNGKHIEGKVLIFFQDMHEKTLKECIEAYTKQLKEQEKPQQQLNKTPEWVLPDTQYHLPKLMPGFMGHRGSDNE
jgi:hypothetical protein